MHATAVFSSNAGKCGKNACQNNFEYENDDECENDDKWNKSDFKLFELTSIFGNIPAKSQNQMRLPQKNADLIRILTIELFNNNFQKIE